MQRSRAQFVFLVTKFIHKNCLGVLATVKPDNSPEAACVEVVVLNDLKLGFCTLDGCGYRKYQFLKRNSAVAFVFLSTDNITVQYEGVAREVGADSTVRTAIEQTFGSEDFTRRREAKFFEVDPTWIRYSDFADNLEESFDIQELSF